MGSTESSYVCFYEQENLWKSQGKKKIANLMLRYKSGFFYQHERTILKIMFRKISSRLSIFHLYRNWKHVWNNYWVMRFSLTPCCSLLFIILLFISDVVIAVSCSGKQGGTERSKMLWKKICNVYYRLPLRNTCWLLEERKHRKHCWILRAISRKSTWRVVS